MKTTRKKMMACVMAIGLASVLLHAPLTKAQNPTSEDMAIDSVFARPAAALATAIGSVAFVLTLPFSLTGGNTDQVGNRFIKEPAYNLFGRPLGVQPESEAAENFFRNDN